MNLQVKKSNTTDIIIRQLPATGQRHPPTGTKTGTGPSRPPSGTGKGRPCVRPFLHLPATASLRTRSVVKKLAAPS